MYSFISTYYVDSAIDESEEFCEWLNENGIRSETTNGGQNSIDFDENAEECEAYKELEEDAEMRGDTLEQHLHNVLWGKYCNS